MADLHSQDIHTHHPYSFKQETLNSTLGPYIQLPKPSGITSSMDKKMLLP